LEREGAEGDRTHVRTDQDVKERRAGRQEGKVTGARSSSCELTGALGHFSVNITHSATSSMDIIFGRNKKEQLEPVRANVTGEHLI
jgi:hypothetical protein